MHNKKWKFGIILAVGAGEGNSGFQGSKTYYVTVNELARMQLARRHVRVGGVFAQGSIERRSGAKALSFRQSRPSMVRNGR